ncbi:MAG: repressor LexA [Clostridia bacterium]|nr:repressor LexA [Clostridia bacterium]
MDKTLENILVLIGSKKGSQRRFTEALGLCPSTVGDWKSGKSRSYTKRLPQIAEYFNISVDSLLRGKEVGSVYPAGVRRPIPVLGTIKAGVPINAEEQAEGSDYADVDDPEEYFYLKVKGDSMIGAGITDGSMVLVRKQNYAEDGQIVVCLVDNEYATLKRYRNQNGTVILMPENPSYQPFILSAADFEQGSAAILGVAVEVKKKLL